MRRACWESGTTRLKATSVRRVPFDRWPTGLGSITFYGFNQGEAHHFYPTLYRNTISVIAPKTPEEGYHLTDGLDRRSRSPGFATLEPLIG